MRKCWLGERYGCWRKRDWQGGLSGTRGRSVCGTPGAPCGTTGPDCTGVLSLKEFREERVLESVHAGKKAGPPGLFWHHHGTMLPLCLAPSEYCWWLLQWVSLAVKRSRRNT